MLRDRAIDRFRERFGDLPQVVAFAPGRVNLIGEHTDTSEGFVFPAAIDRGIAVAASQTEGPSELISEQLGAAATFDVSRLGVGDAGGWGAYPAGVGWALLQGGASSVSNLRAAVCGDLPLGAGLSSSAALELAFGVVWNEIDGLGLEPLQLALSAQRAENEFVGVPCGAMDQLASALGRSGAAMFIDTRTLEIEYARIPEATAIVVCDTLAPRALAASAYAERISECRAAARILGVGSLRDATLADLERAGGEMDAIQFVRARHVITENARCRGFLEALRRENRQRIDALMRASHESLRDDFEVSSPVLDAMAEAAWESPACAGARMTGAGFGGACVALVESSGIEAFIAEASEGFMRRTGMAGSFIVCAPSNGARLL